MIRSALVTLTAIVLFSVLILPMYFAVFYVLFMWVIGDNSAAIGTYAMGIAVPLTLLMSMILLWEIVRRRVGFGAWLARNDKNGPPADDRRSKS